MTDYVDCFRVGFCMGLLFYREIASFMASHMQKNKKFIGNARHEKMLYKFKR